MNAMSEALRLAGLAVGRTCPNPPVGAVIVRDGVIVGRGFTQRAGSWHAEVMAIREAGEAAKGATLFVTLEPCSHHGRTPPCTEAIIAAGIRDVHYSIGDPNPLVSGLGRKALEEAGIKVQIGEGGDQARVLLAPFALWIETGRPRVTAKFAASLDGKIATSSGESKWITGALARERVHETRDQVDAVLTGIGTVLADNPRLTARPKNSAPSDGRQPLRVVVDSRLRTPPISHLLSEPGKTLIAYSNGNETVAGRLVEVGAELIRLPGANGNVDLAALVDELGKRGCLDVLVEAGGTLLGALFDAGLVNRVMAFLAPVVLGGIDSKMAVAGHGAYRISSGWRLHFPTVERIGNDLLIAGDVESLPPGAASNLLGDPQ